MNGLYRKIYQMCYFCYTICSKSIIPNVLFRYAICAFILYCIARESFMTHRFALLFCNGAHRHRGCSACTAFGVKERKSGIGMLSYNSYAAYIQCSKLSKSACGLFSIRPR